MKDRERKLEEIKVLRQKERKKEKTILLYGSLSGSGPERKILMDF